MKTCVISCRGNRITGIWHSVDAAWDAAWAQFGHIGGFSVKVVR